MIVSLALVALGSPVKMFVHVVGYRGASVPSAAKKPLTSASRNTIVPSSGWGAS